MLICDTYILDLLNRYVCVDRNPHVVLRLNVNDGEHRMTSVLFKHLVDLH